jgi:phosphomevalonate kinase
MIAWGESMRDRDEGYFCRLATRDSRKEVWLVSDCRRPSDIDYFVRLYNCYVVRVKACDETRVGRGWSFTSGVDDAPSECALDSHQCDYEIINDDDDGNDGSSLINDLNTLRDLAVNTITTL